MLKIFKYFKKEEPDPQIKEIELSKIDKHINLILRQSLVGYNKRITDYTEELIKIKEDITHSLREFHKKSLMNPNIPRREIQIMEGNRDNYIKRIAHFVTNIDMPKTYLEIYEYSIKLSEDIESTGKEVQKNIFVLNHFFVNEIKDINKHMARLEDIIINIRTVLEHNKILELKEVMEKVKKISKNLAHEKILINHINDNQAIIRANNDKIQKFEERMHTIMSGTEYRALEGFKEEKEKIENEIKKQCGELHIKFSDIETAMKKYYYKNPDNKLLKIYIDDPIDALINDQDITIIKILVDIKDMVSSGSIELKEKKQETCLESINELTLSYLKEARATILKLNDQKQHLQTKITHNSASLNLSEQEYWTKNIEEKNVEHKIKIDKLNAEISKINDENSLIKDEMKILLEKSLEENIKIVDDLNI